MSELMPITGNICSSGEKYDDIVLLNINHDIKNVYAFSAALQKKFGKVIQVGSSYRPSSAEERKPFANGIYYYAIRNRNKTYSLQRNEVPLRIVSPDFMETMDMLITVAIFRDVLPEIEKGKKLFIIEDGGYHSSTMDNLTFVFPELEGNVIGSVEQTTSGTKILSSREFYHYPSISIARSEIKMCMESIFIAQKIVEELSSFIAFTNNFLNFSQVMIIGYGIFGRAVAKKLDAYQCSISVCETDKVIRDAAQEEGYSAVPEITSDDFCDNQIFVAMTGNKSFGKKELMQYLASDADNIILSSGSSKDIEYREILDLIHGNDSIPNLVFSLEETGPFHEKYSVTFSEKQKHFYIMAGGMPLNFCREVSISLTDKMVDLIFAEMALCAIKIIESGSMENRLYLLGDSDAPIQLDEYQMLEDWFRVNKLIKHGESLESNLFIHPCKDYLRSSTFKKMSIRSLM